MPKDFAEQLNDIIAPYTRAWHEPEILSVIVTPDSVGDESITVTAQIKLTRKESHPLKRI